MSRTRKRVALAIVAILIGAGVAIALALPRVVDRRVRDELAALGFPDATFVSVSLGFDRIRLGEVHLAPGADLDTVDLDGGVSLLWSDVGRVTVRGARVSEHALASAVRSGSANRRSASARPIPRVRIEDSTLDVAGGSLAVAGAIAPGTSTTLDVSIDVREPGRSGARASAHGEIVWNAAGQLLLEHGHVDVAIPVRRFAWGTVEAARLSADIAGSISKLVFDATGTLRIERLVVGRELELAAARVPFAVRSDGPTTLRVSGASVRAGGGELVLDPFSAVRGRPLDLVVRARGLELARVLAGVAGRRATGSGLIDGELALRFAAAGWSIRDGSFRARGGGALRLDDKGLRTVVAKQSPFAIHERVMGALADFEFSELSGRFAPSETKPELSLNTRGRGRRVDQRLELDVHINGARGLLHRLAERGIQ